MAAKIKINDHGDCIFTEQEAIDLLYTNPNTDISKLFFDDTKVYNSSLKELGIDLPAINTAPDRENLQEFDHKNINNWHMPDKYYQINVLEWLLDKCQNDDEKTRVKMEYKLFEQKRNQQNKYKVCCNDQNKINIGVKNEMSKTYIKYV